MEDILRFESISDYNLFNQHETLHPLVSLIHFDKAESRKLRRMYFGFYTVFLKQVECGDLRYGLNNYDYQEGTLVFLAPGQLLGDNSDELYQPKGYALVFHPDLIHGTQLGRNMNDYTFFSYASNEALHLSEKERQVILDCFAKIDFELKHGVDKHTKALIVNNIELFLNYCIRYYDRQFITRDNVHKGILEKFEELLNGYFQSNKPQHIGLPSVAWCADEFIYRQIILEILLKRKPAKQHRNTFKSK